MTLAEEYLLERKRIDQLRKSIARDLSGRETSVLYDGQPANTYCVGVLSPTQEENGDDGRAARRRRRKPESIGLTARVGPNSGKIAGRLDLQLALYYRQVPAYAEHLEMLDQENKRLGLPSGQYGDPETKHQLRYKYRRRGVTISDLSFSAAVDSERGLTDIDFTAANRKVNAALQAVRREIEQDPRCWEGVQNYKIERGSLESEKSYEAARSKSDPRLPNWRAEISGHLTHTGDGWRLSLLLQNKSDDDTIHPGELFDVRLEVQLEHGQFIPQPFVAASFDYRYRTQSWGRGINAVLKVNADDPQCVSTETLPVYEQPRARTRHEMVSDVKTLSSDQALDKLHEIAALLEEYATKWSEHNGTYEGDASYEMREVDLAQYRQEIERFRYGIEALSRDERLLHAFKLANEAAATRPNRPLKAWRLFQLVFIVNQAPSLLVREHPSDAQLRKELNKVDVLWYPTGGGKTEAYFGVILMAMFFDRLRGKMLGTTAWLRYPLRMLSIQQLQRLTDFIVAAEQIRKVHNINGDPFTVGYYVGSTNTPNELTRKYGQNPVDQLRREAELNDGDVKSLHVLQRCPYCGKPKPEVKVNASPTRLRLEHRCTGCDQVAPIYLSDSEIYRYLPTVLVGTVDRLARAGQTDRFSHIFGQVEKICPQHGGLSFDRCVEDAACKVSRRDWQSVSPITDPIPALLLQDELHLLKESLGTYDAHYEGFLDVAADRLGDGLPSKRLAATATIEGYEDHIRELYGRAGRRFPTKGLGEWDSAYAERDYEHPSARLYLGVMPCGLDNDVVAKRIAQVVAREAAQYWNDPDHNEEIANLYDLMLIYVNKKSTAGNVGARLKDEYQDERSVLSLTGDRSLDEVREAIDRIEGEMSLPFAERLKTLIATSLISHGVDLDRLNVMAFVGFPGRAADYIQSSSRVGRGHVGLVCIIFDPVSTLDRSTYTHFYEFHERLYQLVQPVPINRFSEASVRRTLNGLYSALAMNVLAHLKRRSGKFNDSLYSSTKMMQALAKGIVSEDEMIQLLVETYGIEEHGLPTEVENMLRDIISRGVRSAHQSIELEEDYATYQRLRPKPIASLREVEEQIEFVPSSKYRYQIEKMRE